MQQRKRKNTLRLVNNRILVENIQSSGHEMYFSMIYHLIIPESYFGMKM